MENWFYVVIIIVLFLHYHKCKTEMENHAKSMVMNKSDSEKITLEDKIASSVVSNSVNNTDTSKMSGFAPTFSPETMVINSQGGLEDNSWSEAVKNLALESTIAESQKRYVENRSHVSSGASIQTLRDDLGSLPNPWSGLRRPDFRVKVGNDARNVPSDDLRDPNTLYNEPTKLSWR